MRMPKIPTMPHSPLKKANTSEVRQQHRLAVTIKREEGPKENGGINFCVAESTIEIESA